MSALSWAVLGGIAAAIFFAVRTIVRQHRTGGCSGCSDCTVCSGSHCSARTEEPK